MGSKIRVHQFYSGVNLTWGSTVHALQLMYCQVNIYWCYNHLLIFVSFYWLQMPVPKETRPSSLESCSPPPLFASFVISPREQIGLSFIRSIFPPGPEKKKENEQILPTDTGSGWGWKEGGGHIIWPEPNANTWYTGKTREGETGLPRWKTDIQGT